MAKKPRRTVDDWVVIAEVLGMANYQGKLDEIIKETTQDDSMNKFKQLHKTLSKKGNHNE